MRNLAKVVFAGAMLASAGQIWSRVCPTVIGHSPNVALFRTVDVDGGYAYIADEYTGLWICDVSRPSDPLFVGSNFLSEGAIDLAVSEGFVYTVGNERLQIIDVSDPTNPLRVGTSSIQRETVGVDVDGEYAFIAYTRKSDDTEIGGLRILDG